jgi:hypothetical protein
VEIGPSERKNPKLQDIDDEEEVGSKHERGKRRKETTYKKSLCTDKNWKELKTRKLVPQWSKWKFVEEVAIHDPYVCRWSPTYSN